MRIAKQEIPTKFDVPGAVARHVGGFGDPSTYDSIAAEFFTLGAGTDIAPLLVGLDDDACASPHWGYMLGGEVVVSYTDHTEETCRGNDMFYWPPGHSVRVTEDTEVVLFSPQAAHNDVLDHMLAVMSQ